MDEHVIAVHLGDDDGPRRCLLCSQRGFDLRQHLRNFHNALETDGGPQFVVDERERFSEQVDRLTATCFAALQTNERTRSCEFTYVRISQCYRVVRVALQQVNESN